MNQVGKFKSKNKKMIVKGSGKFMAKVPGCHELITLGHMTNMRLDIQLDMVDIEGGDSATPIDTLLRKKVIDITAEDAKFDLNMVRLVLGSKIKEAVSGLTYDVEVEYALADQDGDGIVATVDKEVSTNPEAPAVQIFNRTTGLPVEESQFTLVGNTFTFSSGVEYRDNLAIYYGVESDNIEPDGFVWVLEERHLVTGMGGTYEANLDYKLFESTMDNGSKSKIEHVSARHIDSNKLLRRISTPNPARDEYYIDVDSNKILFNEHLAGESIYVNYKRPEVVDVLEIGANDFPLTVHIVHDGLFEQKDGAIQGYQTELYTCRVKSNFTIDAARQQAATHAVTLTVIDPERADRRLGTMKRYQIPAPNIDC